MKNQTMKEIKNKTFVSYHKDGIIDILFGLVITIFGFGMFYNNFTIAGMFTPIIVIFYFILKQKISLPRIGHVKFHSEKEEHKQYKGLLLLGIGMLVLFIVIYLYLQRASTSLELLSLLRLFPTLPLVVPFGIGLIIAGFFLHLNRFYMYCGLVFATAIIGPLLNIHETYYLGFSGIIMLAYGLYLLVTFIQKYPVSRNDR